MWHCLLYSPSQTFILIDKIFLNLLFYRLNSTLTVSSYVRWCLSPLMIFAALHWTCSNMSNFLVLGSPALETVLQVCVSSAEQWGKNTSLDLLAVFFLMHPRLLLSFFAARAHCWLMFNSVSSRTPGPSLERWFLAEWHLPPCLWLCVPRCRSSNFYFLNFLIFLLAHFFNLQRCLWIMVHLSGVLTLPSSFVSPVNLLRVHWVSWPRSWLSTKGSW